MENSRIQLGFETQDLLNTVVGYIVVRTTSDSQELHLCKQPAVWPAVQQQPPAGVSSLPNLVFEEQISFLLKL